MAAVELRNAILAHLDRAEAMALEEAAQDVRLERGQLLAQAGEVDPFVYFPTSGVLSLIGTTGNGDSVELAIIGSDGAAAFSATSGTIPSPFNVVAQIPSQALRVPTSLVARLASNRGDLHRRLVDYAHYLIVQLSQSAICNRFHSARQRLAKWLLMTADRAGTNQLELTHEFIAGMVGGPRSAVTEAAADLRESGGIEYRRGLIVIREPEMLRAQSCECYRLLRKAGTGADFVRAI